MYVDTTTGGTMVTMKLFRLTTPAVPDAATRTLRDELQASRCPFQPRPWPPLPPDLAKPSVVRCRPISSRPSRVPLRLPARPRSSPGPSHYPRGRPDTPRVDPGPFDTLSPRLQARLIDDPTPRPPSHNYGHRLTPDLYSDAEDSGTEDIDDNDSDDSDAEAGGFEPTLTPLSHPPRPQSLRPERLDAVYTPPDPRDMSRFSFEVGDDQPPPFLFPAALPPALANFNLRACARGATDLPTSDPLVLRLVELERFSMVTEDWECRRLRKGPRERAERAARDLRCCTGCLQAACVGDCPEKLSPLRGRCPGCRQRLCTGTCQDSRYEQRQRRPRSSDSLILEERAPPPPPRPHPRGCPSCQGPHNARRLNGNQVLMGRPRSSHATFASAKSTVRPPDLRPSSAILAPTLVRDLRRLGLAPHPPTPDPRPSRPLSRHGTLPGKSLRSNRKHSLTRRKRKNISVSR